MLDLRVSERQSSLAFSGSRTLHGHFESGGDARAAGRVEAGTFS